MKRTGLVGIVLALLAGCSGTDESKGAPASSAQQTAQAEVASETTVSMLELMTFADVALFAFDPDLKPDGTAADNAAAIKTKLGGGDAGCAKITVAEMTGLTADFGSGCTYTNGTTTVTVSGSISLKVSAALQPMHTIGVALTFTSFVVDGIDIDGTASFSTTNGTTFAVKLDVTHASAHVAADLGVVGAPGSFTMNGTASRSDSSGTASLTVTDLVVAAGDCWPRGGSVEMTGPAGDGTLTFDAKTATSGQCVLTIQ